MNFEPFTWDQTALSQKFPST